MFEVLLLFVVLVTLTVAGNMADKAILAPANAVVHTMDGISIVGGPVEQLSMVFELCHEVESELASTLASIDASHGTTSVHCFKAWSTCMDKVARKHAAGLSGYTAVSLCDVLRSRIVTDSIDNHASLIADVSAAMGAVVVDHDDYVTSPAGGFRGHNYTLRATNGALFEVQVTVSEIVAVCAGVGHAAYRAARQGDNSLVSQAKDAYDAAWLAYERRVCQACQEDEGPACQTHNPRRAPYSPCLCGNDEGPSCRIHRGR